MQQSQMNAKEEDPKNDKWWIQNLYNGGNWNLELLVIDHQGVPYLLWQTMIIFLWIISSFVYGEFAAFREYPFAFWKMNICEYIFFLDFLL